MARVLGWGWCCGSAVLQDPLELSQLHSSCEPCVSHRMAKAKPVFPKVDTHTLLLLCEVVSYLVSSTPVMTKFGSLWNFLPNLLITRGGGHGMGLGPLTPVLIVKQSPSLLLGADIHMCLGVFFFYFLFLNNYRFTGSCKDS